MALTRPLTLDEFLLWPEEQPALEFERGAIRQKMSPMARHGSIQGRLLFWPEQELVERQRSGQRHLDLPHGAMPRLYCCPRAKTRGY